MVKQLQNEKNSTDNVNHIRTLAKHISLCYRSILALIFNWYSIFHLTAKGSTRGCL